MLMMCGVCKNNKKNSLCASWWSLWIFGSRNDERGSENEWEGDGEACARSPDGKKSPVGPSTKRARRRGEAAGSSAGTMKPRSRGRPSKHESQNEEERAK